MHFIDWDNNDTFSLRHLAAGSEAVARKHGYKSRYDCAYGDTLLASVSERILRLAVNTRIIIQTLKEMDYYDSHEFVFDAEHPSPVLEQEGDEQIATVIQLCHKIVHASFISLQWMAIEDSKPVAYTWHSEEDSFDYRYWSGGINLNGSRGDDRRWSYLLDVNLVCDAFDWFLNDDSIAESWSRAYRKNVF